MGEHLLISAGDPSGDQHAAHLVEALRARRPGLRVTALGGDHLKKVADKFLFPLVGMGGFGFLEPLAKLPQWWSALKRVKATLKEDRPTLVVPVDFYGFNIHVAEAAQAQGLSVTYYISPQVWASRPGRIDRLKRAVNQMLVIFPFEEALYKNAGVPATFVGHPLLEQLPAPAAPSKPLRIGLLPGSRAGVITRHLPLQVGAAKILRERFPEADFVLFKPEGSADSLYTLIRKETPWIRVVTDSKYEDRRGLSVAISVSGTAALENMLLGIPMVIMYRLSAITFALAKRLIRVPFVGIPNLLAGKSVVPELLQDDATPEKLADAAQMFLENTDRASETRTTLLSLRSKLQQGGTQRAADELARLMSLAAVGGAR